MWVRSQLVPPTLEPFLAYYPPESSKYSRINGWGCFRIEYIKMQVYIFSWFSSGHPTTTTKGLEKTPLCMGEKDIYIVYCGSHMQSPSIMVWGRKGRSKSQSSLAKILLPFLNGDSQH